MQIICEYLKKRFFNTLSLNLPMFVFLLTKDGLDFYRKHHLSNSNILKTSLNGFIGYQRERKFDKFKIELNRFSFFFLLSTIKIQLRGTFVNIFTARSKNLITVFVEIFGLLFK